MYLIVKDVYGDYGDEAKRVIVLNEKGTAEVFRSKQRAIRELKALVESMNIEYKETKTKNGSALYSTVEYSLWDGNEVFYVYELYIDNSL